MVRAESFPKEVAQQYQWRLRFSHVIWEFLNKDESANLSSAVVNREAVHLEEKKRFALNKIAEAEVLLSHKIHDLTRGLDENGDFFDPADKKASDEYTYTLRFLHDLEAAVRSFGK